MINREVVTSLEEEQKVQGRRRPILTGSGKGMPVLGLCTAAATGSSIAGGDIYFEVCKGGVGPLEMPQAIGCAVERSLMWVSVKVRLEKPQCWTYFVCDPQSEIRAQVRSCTVTGQLVYYEKTIIVKKKILLKKDSNRTDRKKKKKKDRN